MGAEVDDDPKVINTSDESKDYRSVGRSPSCLREREKKLLSHLRLLFIELKLLKMSNYVKLT